MIKELTNVAVLGGMVLTLAGVWPAPAAAGSRPPSSAIYGVIEQLPDTPDLVGAWTVGGRTVFVDAKTRFDHRSAGRSEESRDYWTQTASGVVVRAPGWTSDEAQAAGFRPAARTELGGCALGQPVKVKIAAAGEGRLRAVEIELRDKADSHTTW